jgi:transposase InsO family protein
VPARSTINRVFDGRGQLAKVPQRAPRRRWRRFQRDKVNDLWQYDGFEWQLLDGTRPVVLHLNDDCSRLDLALEVVRSENSEQVWDTFCLAVDRYDLPAAVLNDNGTAFSGRRRGWTAAFEANRGCQMACVNGRVRRRAGCACSWKETYPYVRPEADLEVQDVAGA